MSLRSCMIAVYSSLMALFLGLAPGTAAAARPALEPQNRVHAGLSVTGGELFDTPSFGATVGFDSRMTRVVFVDVGGFVSPIPMPEISATFDDPAQSIYLRHGLYVAPGFRVPHKSGDGGLSWDVLGRVGFAGVWWTDVQSTMTLKGDEYLADLSPAAVVGLDGILRKEKVGARLGAKGYGFVPFSQSASEPVRALRPQVTAEFLYQW